jgi:hypothetical protein
VQDSVGVLSVRLATVTSRKSRSRFMTSSFNPASLLEVTVVDGPLGFSNVISWHRSSRKWLAPDVEA